jgi:serine protease AprX
VTFVALDVPVRPASASSPLQPTASFAAADQAPYAWSRGAIGRGVGIAIIDSGVAAPSAFGGRLVHVDLGGGARPDTFGHGTFVAAIAAASLADVELSGIAPGARVFDVNVSQDDGVYTSDVLTGLEWVRQNHRRLGIRVVNLSLTETVSSSHTRSPLDAAVERLWHAGVVVVVAVGNTGPGTAVYAPANDPYVITVGAVDQGMRVGSSDDAEAAFSATGPTLDGFAKPDVLAPGRRVVSILPPLSSLVARAPEANVLGADRYSMSGTSFSAPQVAGAAAVLLAHNPRWTPAQVKWVLTRTARDVPGSRAGALDLRRALTFAGRPRSANRDLPGAATERFRPDALFAPDAWAGNTWSGNAWAGNTWAGNTWAGNTWSGNTWTGNTWTGNTWVGLADPFAP